MKHRTTVFSILIVFLLLAIALFRGDCTSAEASSSRQVVQVDDELM